MACRLMETLGDSQASAREVAEVVRQDISLSAKILRLANSAFYGVPRTVSSITDAVVLLGTKVIGTLVLSLTVFDLFPGKGGRAFDRMEFWRHSLLCAATGRLLAGRLDGGPDPEDAFCACLLHDIGKIVMDQYLQDDMKRVMEEANSAGIPFYQSERKLLDYSHADVALWLTSNWNLPDVVVVPMVNHHEPLDTEAELRDAACVCHLADHLTYAPELERPSLGRAAPLDPGCRRILNVSSPDIEWVKNRMEEEMTRMHIFRDLFPSA